MRDVKDPGTQTTWYTWNKSQLQKARNERQTATHPHISAFFGVLQCLPIGVLVLSSIYKLRNTKVNSCVPPSLQR